MRVEGISTRYALELLSRDLVPLAASPSADPPPKQSTVPKLPPLFAPTVDDQQALKNVVNYSHETLKNSPDSPKAKQYLVQRALESSEMIEHFRLGLSNRTLNYHVPDKNRAAGAEIPGRLEKLGILRHDTGHEHFNGSVVIPIFNLLRDPRLLNRILADLERCGVAGEETNKKIGYLSAVSRLLDTPLAVMVQSEIS